MSTTSPVSDELLEGKEEAPELFTRIKVPLSKLNWDFMVIRRLLAVGENAKVFKFRADGHFCYIEAATSVFFRDLLAPCTEVFDYTVAFVDITPLFDAGQEVIITFEANTVSFDGLHTSTHLHHTYGTLPDMEIPVSGFVEIKETSAYVKALRTLNSPTILKNSFSSSASCYLCHDRIISTYPICWLQCKVPDNGFDQVVRLDLVPLLLEFLTHVKVQFNQGDTYFMLRYRDAYLAIPRHAGNSVDFTPFTTDKIPVCKFKTSVVVSTLKSVLSFEKVPFITLYLKDGFLSIFTEASTCSVHKQFVVSEATPNAEYVFNCQSEFLLTCLSLFDTSEEVSLEQCRTSQRTTMILTSTSMQLILSLRS